MERVARTEKSSCEAKHPYGKFSRTAPVSQRVQKISNENATKEKKVDEMVRSMIATLRRLKIQEKLLQTAIDKAIDQQMKENSVQINCKRMKESTELKDSLLSIEELFDKFKHNVSSPECIKNIDIAEYKRMATELDEKIVYLEKFLDKELNSLRLTEKEVLSDIAAAGNGSLSADVKRAARPYASVVSSVVKGIRSRPSDYPEVRQLQEWLETHGGRRGGWGEREHAVFLKCRRLQERIPESTARTLAEQIPGLTVEEAVAHESWYCEYRRLQAQQRDAVARWRSERRVVEQSSSSFHTAVQDSLPNSRQASRTKTTHKKGSRMNEKYVKNTKTSSSENINGEDRSVIEPSNLSCNSTPAHTMRAPQRIECISQNYLKPTTLWSMKTENLKKKGPGGRLDFRLHIPMANSPKLGLADWRRCLVGET